jgi:hypothetical protein
MVRSIGIVLGIGAFLAVSIGVLNWETNNNPVKSFLKQNISYSNSDVISNIDVEFKNGAVLLNVHTSQITSCDGIKSILDIKPLIIKNKTYIPQCSSVSDDLIQITYILDNSV